MRIFLSNAFLSLNQFETRSFQWKKGKKKEDLCPSKQTPQDLLFTAFFLQTFLLVLLPVNELPKPLTYCRLSVNFCKEVLSIFKNSYSKALSHGRRMQFTKPALRQLRYSGDGRVKGTWKCFEGCVHPLLYSADTFQKMNSMWNETTDASIWWL